jgi:hypothetical protein
LVLELPERRGLWAIEIKRGLGVQLDKGFHHAVEDLRPARRFVAYPGEERYPLAKGVEAIGVLQLTREIGSSG